MTLAGQPSFAENVVEVRADAILTAAAVLSDWISCQDKDWLLFYMTYTEAAAGGIVEFQIRYRPSRYLGSYEQTALAVGAVASGADTVSLLQQEWMRYGGTAVAAETFMYGPISLRGCVEDFQLVCLESAAGNPLNPGNFAAYVQMGDRMP